MKVRIEKLKLVLIVLGPFWVGWLVIAYGVPQEVITEWQRAVFLLSFTVCWVVSVCCYGLYQEKQWHKEGDKA